MTPLPPMKIKPYLKNNKRLYSLKEMLIDTELKNKIKDGINKTKKMNKYITPEEAQLLYMFKNRDLIEDKENVDDTPYFIGRYK